MHLSFTGHRFSARLKKEREVGAMNGMVGLLHRGLLVTTVFIVVLGCAQPPREQLDAAQKAVDAAKAADAATYAKDDFAKLEQQFALAKDELAKQEQLLPIFRSYSDANAMLVKVVEEGGHVAAKAAQAKEAAKTAALAAEKEAQQAVASAKELMTHAPTGKDKAAVEAIRQDLAALETSLGPIRQLIDKGDFVGAEAQAKAVKEKGAAVSAEIQSAIDKTKAKKPTARARG
jgi:predicted enzyme related to lactoylglutathione lyase